ncbi:hypothetical protein K7432_016591, partial [Basidiobolus ranarum]
MSQLKEEVSLDISRETRVSHSKPIQLVFSNLSYTVGVKDPHQKASLFKRTKSIKKTILDNLTGTFQPGRVTAILDRRRGRKIGPIQIDHQSTAQGQLRYFEIFDHASDS